MRTILKLSSLFLLLLNFYLTFTTSTTIQSLPSSEIQTNVSNTTKCYFFNEYRTHIGLVHTCFVNRSQKIANDDFEIIFENVKDHEIEIKHFAAEGVIYKFMPQNLENTFGTNLRGLEVTYSNLEFIRQKDLKAHFNLSFLNLRGNLIRCIDKDTFSCNPNLEFISLKHNRIRRINPLAFVHLQVLQQLWFAHNFCYFGDANTTYEIPLTVKKIGQECLPIFKMIDDNLFSFKCSSLDASEIEGDSENAEIYTTEERVRYKIIRDEAIKNALTKVLRDSRAREEVRELCRVGEDNLV